jgi:hypothetical protein
MSKEKYNEAALELIAWVERNAELEAALGVLFMDMCLDFWFKCAGPESAMEAIDKLMRAKIAEHYKGETNGETN